MRIQVTERHCQVPAATRERAEKRLAAMAKYSPRASAAEVVFFEEGVNRVVEVITHVDGGEPVVARAEDTEFRPALEKVLERISRRLRKQRERRTDHQAPSRRGRASGG